MAAGQKTGGRTKGTPNKATRDIKEAAAEYSQEALDVLVKVARNTKSPAAARVAAANGILDRAHGKPKQAVDVDANVRAAVTQIERRIVKADHSNS